MIEGKIKMRSFTENIFKNISLYFMVFIPVFFACTKQSETVLKTIKLDYPADLHVIHREE